jgi:co-chaperonin GroES (HSP10)
MAIIKPLKNNVMFAFLDSTGGSKGRFTPRSTASGIILVPSLADQKKARWGEVLAAGPDADVSVGDFILVEALMWMEGTEVDGVKMWKTDDTKILVVTDDIDSCDSQ